MDFEGVHKETFHQQANDGIPSHWVVFYWPDDCSPASDTHKAAYFNSYDDCKEFEGKLQDYDDWYTSQEEPLSVQ